MKVADINLGMTEQPIEILKILSNSEIDCDYSYDIKTRSWYNGRERGFVISAGKFLSTNPIHIAVYEHRNSDNIGVLKWDHHSYHNSPLEDKEIFDNAFPNKNSSKPFINFSSGEYQKCADWIIKEIKMHLSIQNMIKSEI